MPSRRREIEIVHRIGVKRTAVYMRGQKNEFIPVGEEAKFPELIRDEMQFVAAITGRDCILCSLGEKVVIHPNEISHVKYHGMVFREASEEEKKKLDECTLCRASKT
jgi:hypothetical protein